MIPYYLLCILFFEETRYHEIFSSGVIMILLEIILSSYFITSRQFYGGSACLLEENGDRSAIAVSLLLPPRLLSHSFLAYLIAPITCSSIVFQAPVNGFWFSFLYWLFSHLLCLFRFGFLSAITFLFEMDASCVRVNVINASTCQLCFPPLFR